MIQSTNLTLIFHLLNALINVHVCVFSSMQLVMYEFVQDTEQFHYKDRLCYPLATAIARPLIPINVICKEKSLYIILLLFERAFFFPH